MVTELRTDTLKWVRRAISLYPVSISPKPAELSDGRGHLSLQLLLGGRGRKEWSMHAIFQLYGGLPEGETISPHSKHWQDQHGLDATENKEEWKVACCTITACGSWQKVHNLGHIPWERRRGKTELHLFRELPEYWQSCRGIINLIHCWWECELEHSLTF